MKGHTEFRPNLPKDPFADTPWVFNPDALKNSSTATTVLVLNTPPPADLATLLYASPALAHSLVIIATHNVPVFPLSSSSASVVPTVRVLRLREPMFGASAAGALNVMSVLDKAARFTLSPLALPAPPPSRNRVQIYSEDPVSGEFTVREETVEFADAAGKISVLPVVEHGGGSTATPSTANGQAPSASMTFLSLPPPPPPTDKKKKRRTLNLGFGSSTSVSSASLLSSPSSSSGISLPSVPSALSMIPIGVRPFDTLIHYLPSSSPYPAAPSSSSSSSAAQPHLPEKVLLKQAILVTSLSAPYLAAPPEPPAYLRLPSNYAISRRTSASKSMPRLDSLDASSSSDVEGGPTRKRRNTMLSRVSTPTSAPGGVVGVEEAEDPNSIPTSKSMNSFQALKRRLTIGRKDKDKENADASALERNGTVKAKRRSSMLRRSGTQRQTTPAAAEQPSNVHEPELEEHDRYTGRSHIVHVVDFDMDLVADLGDGPSSSSRAYNRSSQTQHHRHSPQGRISQQTRNRPAAAKPSELVKSIEKFLVAFAYPAQGLSLTAASPSPSPSSSTIPTSTSMLVPSHAGSRVSASSSSSATTFQSSSTSPAPHSLGSNHLSSKPIPFVVKSGALSRMVRYAQNLPGSGTNGTLAARYSGELDGSMSLVECVAFGCLDGGVEGEGVMMLKAWLDVDDRNGVCLPGGGVARVDGGAERREYEIEEQRRVRVNRHSEDYVPVQKVGKEKYGFSAAAAILTLKKRASLQPPSSPPSPPAKSPVSNSRSPIASSSPTASPRLHHPSSALISPTKSVAEVSATAVNGKIERKLSRKAAPPIIPDSFVSPRSSPSPPHHHHHHNHPDSKLSFKATGAEAKRIPAAVSAPQLVKASRSEAKPAAVAVRGTPKKTAAASRAGVVEVEEDEWEEGNRTGLLTPPESTHGSDSGEEDLATVSPRIQQQKGQKAEGGPGSPVVDGMGMGEGSQSFDIVQAYMYDRDECPLAANAAAAAAGRGGEAPVGEERKKEKHSSGRRAGTGEHLVSTRQQQQQRDVNRAQVSMPNSSSGSSGESLGAKPHESDWQRRRPPPAVMSSPDLSAATPAPAATTSNSTKSAGRQPVTADYMMGAMKRPVRAIYTAPGDGTVEEDGQRKATNTSRSNDNRRVAQYTTTSNPTNGRIPPTRARGSSNPTGMGVREAREYANAIKGYHPPQDSGYSSTSAASGDVSSVRASSGSFAPAGGSGGRKDMCSLVGVPPSIGKDMSVQDSKEMMMKPSKRSRRSSEGAMGRRGEKSPLSESVVPNGAGRGKDKEDPQQQEGDTQQWRYHYKKPRNAVPAAAEQDSRNSSGAAVVNRSEASKHRRSSRFGEFVGKVFLGTGR